MYLLLSGEGPSDIGACVSPSNPCEGDDFKPGPMSLIIDQLVESAQGFEFSHLQSGCIGFLSETSLASKRPKRARKSPALRGKKRPVETKYFFENARALAIAAHEHSKQIGDKVVAILFRDADGTASAGRGIWDNKHASMIEGFKIEGYGNLGVPMIPKPKSEAWLLCAVKSDPYQACDNLENESGNDRAPNSLKVQLADALEGKSNTAELNALLSYRDIDLHRIDMSSFNIFKDALEHAVHNARERNA